MRVSGPPTTHNRHHKAVPLVVKEAIRISDIIVEILDARDLNASRNKEIEEEVLLLGKKLIHAVNKIDLVDFDKLKESGEYMSLSNPVGISVKNRIGIKKLREKIIIEAKRLKEKRRAHVTFIGYPNVGKSSLTNILARRNAVSVSSEAGWTKSIQKIRLTKDILILDVPGLIKQGEHFGLGQENLKTQAKIGVQTPERMRNPEFIVAEIMKDNPEVLENYYSVDAEGDAEILIDELGKRWKFLKKGGIADSDRTARKIMKAWMSGEIRRK